MKRNVDVIPRYIGNYTILNQIGEGATAKVHMARNTDTQETLCVKILEKKQINTEETFTFFRREVSIISSINHPNIAKYYDLLEDSQFYFLFMEYCKGESLQAAIDKPGNLPENFIISVFKQLLSALQYLHEAGIGHRDLKPDNILIGPGQHVKIVDFGLSTNDNSQLRTTFCGSLAFAAPECIQREPYIASKADMWSAGVILYMMAVGKLPWNTTNLVRIMKNIVAGKYTIPTNVPNNCQELIRAMMNVNPNQRPLASELLDFINHHWREHDVKKPHPPQRTSARHRSFPGPNPRAMNGPMTPQRMTRINSDPLFCVSPPRAVTPRKPYSPRRMRQRSNSLDQLHMVIEDRRESSILASIPDIV